jgi:phage terminase small subunit
MMTPQREAFATELASGCTQAEAYRRAFPKSRRWKDETVWKRASELAAVGEVQGRVRELVAKAAATNQITVDRVLREMGRLAFFDPRRLMHDDGTPKAMNELDDDTAAVIAGLEVARIGNGDVGLGEVLKFKFADKNAALEKLAKHLGMYREDNDQQRPIVAPTLDVSGLSTQALAEIVKARNAHKPG